MKKGLYSIIACVVLLGGMVALYFAHNAQVAEQAATPAPMNDSITLLSLEKADVVKLEIVRPDETLTFLRDGEGQWSLAGTAAPLRQSYITEMAEGLCGLYAVEMVGDSIPDVDGYGFAPPAATLTVALADGTAATVHIGAQTPAKDYYYMMCEGDPAMYLIYNVTGERYLRNLAALVDSAMAPISVEDMLSFSMQVRGSAPISAVRLTAEEAAEHGIGTGFGTANMEVRSPVTGKDMYMSNLDDLVVQPMNGLTLGTLAAEATEENLAAYGFLDPMFDIVAEGASYRYHLTVGNDADALGETAYAIYEGVPFIYKVDTEVLKPIYNLSVFRLMDHFMTLLNIDTVDGITIEAHTRGIRHELATNHKEIPAATNGDAPTKEIYPTVNGVPVQDKAFRNYYQIVIGISFDALDETFVPDGNPAVTITYTRNGGLETVTDRYYEYNANFYAALQADNTVVYLVSKQAVNTAVDEIDNLLSGAHNE